MAIIYDLIFLFISLFYLPIYLFRGKFHEGLWQRMGFLPKDLELAGPIWVHAVSVGETMAVKGLVDSLRKAYPRKKFVFSTVTATGNRIAQNLKQEGDLVTYLPLDFSFIVKSIIERIKPALFIIVETEIWPNLISCLAIKKIPVVLVNARISDKSFGGYKLVRVLLKTALHKVSLFCCQSQLDKDRFIAMGVLVEKVKVTGNMKFDITPYADKKTPYADLKNKLGLAPQDRLWVCGSTHPGEEEIIFAVYKKLSIVSPELKLLVAPRHPERAGKIEKVAAKYGFQPPVFIVGSVGQLLAYYAIADIVFVGGSLVKKGGHNILEPAAVNKPVIFGPYMFNFRDISDLFLRCKAGIMVKNSLELEKTVRDLLASPAMRENLGNNAKSVIAQNRGATQKNLEEIKNYA